MKREHPDERRNISRSSVAVTGGMMSGKNMMTEKSAASFDAGFEQQLAQVGYQIRSSDMADVALKLEQLEMAMVNSAEDGVLHLSTDTIHYNPADVSNWLDSMLSEFNAPYVPNLDPNQSSLLEDAISSTKSSSDFVNSTQINTQPSRIYDPCPNYDLSAIPGELVCAKTDQSESSSGRESKRLKSSPPHQGASSPETIRPVVLIDSQETGIRLVHTLMACAEAVHQGNLTIAEALVKQIGLLAAAQPGAMKKVASYFAEALACRIYNLYHEPLNPSISDILQMHFYETCPYLKFAHFTANQAILEAFAGKSRVHVIDFSINQGMQWPVLMQALALRPGGPPAFRLTGIGPRQPDNSDALQRVGWKLAQLAETINIEFEFRGLVTNNLEELDPSLLDIRANDSVAVNSIFVLHRLLAQPGAIDKVFSCIKSIRPKILTIVEQEANHNGPVFLDRFTESLHYYSSMFDSLEGCGMSPPTSEDLVMSEEYLGRQICNVVACEGPERVERHETLAQWCTRLGSAGFAPVHLGSNAFKQASMLLALFAGGDGYKVEENNGCLMLSWHTRPLIATSAWHIVEH